MSEKQFSKKVKKELRDAGFFVLDLESLGGGVPDSLVINPRNDKCIFVEFKTKTGRVTRAQKAWFAKHDQDVNCAVMIEGGPITTQWIMEVGLK